MKYEPRANNFLVATVIFLTIFLAAISGCGGGNSEGIPKEDNKAPGGGSPKGKNPQGGSETPPPSPPSSGGDVGSPSLGGSGGPFDCPTVDKPRLTVGSALFGTKPENTVAATLSMAFGTSCAACHGTEGKGQGPYPALPGELSLSEFIGVVRNGRGLMPKYDARYIPDAQLEADYNALKALAGGNGNNAAGGQAASWEGEKLQQVLKLGMTAWRTPDANGFACAGCHAPDAIDLAMIGYQDDQILRRAALHVDPETANQIVHFIHAQREVWKIDRPCSPSWRVLQPGGEVLPGETPHEQEASFFDQLTSMKLDVVSKPVKTLDDARAVIQQFAGINLRTLKNGIPLARWTEDAFNGPNHASWNDYMPMLGTKPNDPQSWYKRLDEYIADPSDEKFFGIYDDVVHAVNDGGHAAKFPHEQGSRVRPYPDADGKMPRETVGTFLSGLNMDKRRMNLVLQHLMRTELRSPGSWSAGKAMPYDNAPKLINPFMKFSIQSIENMLDAGAAKGLHETFLQSFPEDFRHDIPNGGADPGLEHMAVQVNHPWMTLAQIYDQTNFTSTETIGNAMTYWSGLKFEQKFIHMPFFHFHRLVTQHENMQKYFTRKRDAYPITSSMFLEGHDIQQVQTWEYTNARQTPTYKESNLIKLNIVRTIFLFQKHLIEAGGKVYGFYEKGGHQRGFEKFQLPLTRKFIQAIAEDINGGQAHPLIAQNAALYTTELAALVDDVERLMRANLAPCRDSDGPECQGP